MANSFSWSNLFLALLGCYLVVAALLYFSQSSQVYHPPKGHTGTPAQWGMDFETVHLNSEGVTLVNWWIPGREDRPVVLFFHGNATNISEMQGHVSLFSSLGMGVFLLDYRGYGLSEGEPSEAGTQADAEAAWRYLVEMKNIPADRLLFYGHSLGGGVASGLAVDHPPGWLVLEGTFTSIPDVAAQLYPYLPVRLMAHIIYPNLDRIARIKAPLLVIHSSDDEIIPDSHGKKLFEAAHQPKQFYPASGSHHSGFSSGGRQSIQVLSAFIFPSEG
ncbi:MAG: alpha/beta fold hydrolase [Magnetococcales bacterium]|nr:alpha/beta fold hydrolase [Magnetococcales bacterium]